MSESTTKTDIFTSNPLWPDAKWDVSGAFACDRELLAFHDFFSTLGPKPLTLVHGSPLFHWNSGRVMPHLMRNAEEIRAAGLAYAERNISIDYTFTNFMLKEKDLADKMGNVLLQFAEKFNPTKGNGIIVASDLLYEHVKKNYPTLRLVSSILKVTEERGKGKRDYYLKLAEKYDKVMIHPDDILNYDLLESLEDKDKYEIIVNEYCIRNCPIRHLHYRSLCRSALDYLDSDDDFEAKHLNKNGCRDMNVLACSDKHSVLALNVPEMKNIYNMGFRNFKMQGRGAANSIVTIFDLLRLVIRPIDEDDNTMHRIKIQFLEYLSRNPDPQITL